MHFVSYIGSGGIGFWRDGGSGVESSETEYAPMPQHIVSQSRGMSLFSPLVVDDREVSNI